MQYWRKNHLPKKTLFNRIWLYGYMIYGMGIYGYMDIWIYGYHRINQNRNHKISTINHKIHQTSYFLYIF